MKRLITGTSILLLSATMLLLMGCAEKNGAPAGSGLLEANETIVSAQVAGQVVQRFVSEGDEVQSGDTLAVIDPSRLQLQLNSAIAAKNVAEAGLETAMVQLHQATTTEEYAAKELNRITRLVKSGTATAKQYDKVEFERTSATLARQSARAGVVTIQAEISRANATIAQLRRELVDCYPLAPTTGTVTEEYVEPGEVLAPGKPIVKMARLDTLWVKVYLTAGDFSGIVLGDKATVDTESGETTYQGTVVWTSENAEFTPKNVQTKKSRADLVYAVKVAIANPDRSLKIGMPVYVTLEK